MNIRYRMVRRYILGVSAVTIGLLLALKITKTGSSASVLHSVNKNSEYKINKAFANIDVVSARRIDTPAIIFFILILLKLLRVHQGSFPVPFLFLPDCILFR